MIRKVMIGMVLAICAMTASAGTVIDTSGLTDAQIAELKASAARAVADAAKGVEPVASKDVSTTVTLAATWGQQAATAAEGFAKALGIAARELGVTVNDFLHTDAGKLTAILIIWKVAGAAIVKALYGTLFVAVGLSVARVIYYRLFTLEYKQVEYSRLFGAFKGTKMVRVPKTIGQFRDDGEWLAHWMMIGTVVLTLAVGTVFF